MQFSLKRKQQDAIRWNFHLWQTRQYQLEEYVELNLKLCFCLNTERGCICTVWPWCYNAPHDSVTTVTASRVWSSNHVCLISKWYASPSAAGRWIFKVFRAELNKVNWCGYWLIIAPAKYFHLQSWALTEEPSLHGGDRVMGKVSDFYALIAQNDHNKSAVGLIGLWINNSDSKMILPSAEASSFTQCK